MFSKIVILVIALCLTRATRMNRQALFFHSHRNQPEFKHYSRTEWNARTPNHTIPLSTPVPYVVIHHSYTPPACNTTEECCQAMRSMQNFHIDDRGWWDIGYNFAVGSDGGVYEGRGWQTLGAHALHFNTVSIGICLIGDWSEKLPPKQQIEAAKTLIKKGVSLGYVKQEYKLIGHRQVRDTECPGQALFENIRSWGQYSKFPSSAAQLELVEELPAAVKEFLTNKIVNR